MVKTKTSEWDTTEGNNSDIGGTNIAEGCAAGNVNNALREIMAQIAAARTGADDGILTGTPGASGYLGVWNADGDLVTGAAILPDSTSLAFGTGSDFTMLFDATDVIAKLDGAGVLRFRDSLDQQQLGVYENGGTILGYRGVEQFKTVSGGVEIIGTVAGTAVQTTLTDDDTKLATSGGVVDYVGGFTSTAQTITGGGLLTLAHGLASAPGIIQFRLVCNDVAGDQGYAQGDVIHLSPGYSGDRDTNRTTAAYADATNVYVRFAPTTTTFYYATKGAGVAAPLTNSSWDFYVEARP